MPLCHKPRRMSGALRTFDGARLVEAEAACHDICMHVWQQALAGPTAAEGVSSQGSPQSPAAVQILVVEGLHPFHDERVRKLMDFHIYLDISDEVKEAWKIQRDSQERGHSEESIRASIAARKPDFDTFIDPQKKHADVIIQVPCSTWPCPAAFAIVHM